MATATPFGGNELIGEGKDERCKKFGAFHFLCAFFIFWDFTVFALGERRRRDKQSMRLNLKVSLLSAQMFYLHSYTTLIVARTSTSFGSIGGANASGIEVGIGIA